MKILTTAITVMMIGFFYVTDSNLTADDKIIGSWAFNVNQAPWEYSQGTIIFEANDDGELTGVIHFHTGQQISIASITVEDAEMTFDVTVDGYDVRSIVNIGSDELSGHVVTFEGNMPFTATREKGDEAGE